MSYWFFLSYARYDLNPTLTQFYDDLADAVRLRAGGEKKDVGFFDGTLGPGESWTDALETGLQTCRAFVALYSATYFDREFCGKEWQVFRSRLDRLAAGDKRPPLIFPVLWGPEETLKAKLPAAAKDIQYKHADFGKLYAEKGLFELMTVNEYHDSYRKFLGDFAQLLWDRASQYELPTIDGAEVSTAQSAFQAPKKDQPAAVQVEPDKLGPRHVKFIFIVGTKDELRQIARTKLDHYGDSRGKDWRPYDPVCRTEMGRLALVCAASDVETLDYDVVPVDDSLLSQLEAMEKNNNVVIIVVDTWTLKVERYRNQLKQFDDRNFVNCAVLVPWNLDDEEVSRELKVLQEHVGWALGKRVVWRDPTTILAIDRINNSDQLATEMAACFNKVRMRLIEYAQVAKPISSGQTIPAISVPGAQS
jgi:FxsC-like protein